MLNWITFFVLFCLFQSGYTKYSFLRISTDAKVLKYKVLYLIRRVNTRITELYDLIS